MRLVLVLLSASFLVPGQVAVRGPAGGAGPAVQARKPAYKPEELCTVAGVVRHSVTGEPIRKANLMLARIEPSAEMNPPATTSSNAEGKFAMKNIEPGQYRLNVNKPGFTGSMFGQGGTNQTLTLEKGQSMTEIELKMTPHAVVMGRVTDEDNDPVMNARVALMRYRYFQGKKQLVPGGMAQTNDLGEYRLFGVGPGKYYVSAADSMRYGFNFGVDRSAVRQAEETPATTYYPSAADVVSAVLVNVPMGGAVQGIDIRLRKEKAFRVAGKVTGMSAQARGGMVMLVRKDGADMMAMDRNMSSWRGPAGEFELKGVRPGSYIVRANFFEPPDHQLSGAAALEVTDGDVEGLSVMLTQGIEISGGVRSEAEPQPKLDGISIFLESRTNRMMQMGNSMGRVKEDGGFQIANALPDHYDVRVNGVPPDYFIRSIRLTDTDVRENGLNVSSGVSAAGVEIVLSPKAAQLEGTVADGKGNPLKGAAVILRPKSGKSWELAAMRPVTSDQNGRFKMQGLMPGEYHLIAFEGVEAAEALDPDFFKDHESKAETVKLAESATETRALKAITAPAQ